MGASHFAVLVAVASGTGLNVEKTRCIQTSWMMMMMMMMRLALQGAILLVAILKILLAASDSLLLLQLSNLQRPS